MNKTNQGSERWKEIEGFPDYMVSDRGRVWSRHRGRCLKPKVTKKGYYFFNLQAEGKGHPKRLNRLVAEAFLENPKGLPVVNHIDGDKTNNDVSNLEWVSYRQNTRHAYKVGLMKRALDDSQIEELRALYATGDWTQDRLADRFGICRTTVCEYVRDVDSPRHKTIKGIVPPEMKEEIRRLYATGDYTQRELAERFGLNRWNVCKCVRYMEEAQ